MSGKTGKRGIRYLFSLLVTSLFNLSMAHADDLKTGDMAPDFTLLDQNNQSQTLSEYRGYWTVLYFYPKNDTPGCTTEACKFRDDIAVIRKLDARVMGISIDSPESHKAFAEKHQLPFTLLTDTEGKVAEQYGAYLSLVFFEFARRHTFIINPQGKIAKIYRDVDPSTHSQEIIQDLNQLIASSN